MTSTLLLMSLLVQAAAGTQTHAETVAEEPALIIHTVEGPHHVARVEVSGLALRQEARAGTSEGFVQVEPGLILDWGDGFGVEVGAPLRLRLAGPRSDGGGLVRAEDWDSLSDFGQLVRELRVGQESSPAALWVGALEEYSLLSGHLVRRYSNRANPDYHPAGAWLTGTLGPAYLEAFASDVMGARLLGGEVALDLVHLVAGPPKEPGHHTLSISAAHDFGLAGGRSPSVTLAHADLSTSLFYREDFQVHAVAGAGARLGQPGAWGAVLGLGLESRAPRLLVSGRLEARHQRGGFRQGFFGPDYELSRFRAPGPAAVPVAEALFPDGASAFGELVVGWDSFHLEHALRGLQVSVAAEVFSWGQVDADAYVSTHLDERRLYLELNARVMAAGQSGTR